MSVGDPTGLLEDDDKQKLVTYRKYLVDLLTKTEEEFDRTLLTLAGGALGVSFAFVKDFLGTEAVVGKNCLVVAWSCWIATLALILISQFGASATMARTLRKLDKEKWLDPDNPGGPLSSAVFVATGAAGLFFLVGLIVMAYFITLNVR